MDRNTLTANLKPLGRRGLVAVGINPRDRHALAFRSTEDGRRAPAEGLPLWRNTQAAVAGQLAGELAVPVGQGLGAPAGGRPHVL